MAGDDGQLHVLPILAGEVLDNRPALEQAPVSRSWLRQPDPVGGLPQRRLHHIADPQGTRAAAAGDELEGAPVALAMARHRRERAVDLGLELGVAEAHCIRILKQHLADAVGGEHAQAVPGDRAAVRQRHLFGADAKKPAAERPVAQGLDLGPA